MSLEQAQKKLERAKQARQDAEAELKCERLIAQERERASKARIELARRNEPMNLVPRHWLTTFEQATTQEEWDRILMKTERSSPTVHLAAKRACQGRDSRSKRQQEARERARDFLDSF